MATTMNISLPDDLRGFVDEQVRERAFGSTSEYIRELIRKQRKCVAENRLRALIAEGLASGPAVPVDDAWFDELRERARHRPVK